MRSKPSREIPRPPIADVLKELGVTDVPFGLGWVRMTCPFCDDSNGSASVNHDVQGFRCHQCGRSGDGLKLLQTEGGFTFAEACKRARALSTDTVTESGKPRRKRRASDLLKGVT